MWNIYLVFIDWQQQTLKCIKDIKQFSLLKMLYGIGLLRWDSVEMISVMPVIYSVTCCCIISSHSLTLIKGKGLLLPVNLCNTGAFIQNQVLILDNKNPSKTTTQKYSFCTAIQHYWSLADKPMVEAVYKQEKSSYVHSNTPALL